MITLLLLPILKSCLKKEHLLNTHTHCLCGSGIDYQHCCGFYHSGEKIPETAEALMRSRYTAYSLRNGAQKSLDNLIQGLMVIEERPTLAKLRRYLEGGPSTLVVQALERYYDNCLGDWRRDARSDSFCFIAFCIYKVLSVWVVVIFANNLPNTIELHAIKALVLRCAFALYLAWQFD